MCLGPHAQPVNMADPQARQMRGLQIIGSAIQAGQGNAQAKQNLTAWRSMFQANHPGVAAGAALGAQKTGG